MKDLVSILMVLFSPICTIKFISKFTRESLCYNRYISSRSLLSNLEANTTNVVMLGATSIGSAINLLTLYTCYYQERNQRLMHNTWLVAKQIMELL